MIGATRYTASVEIARQSALSGDIAKLQQSISSNKRLSAASDDPVAAARIADLRQGQADNAIWSRNADIGASIAGAADKALVSVTSMMARAKELIVSGANETNTLTDRSAIATELRSIVDQLATVAASSDSNGQPLFPASDPLAIPLAAGLSLSATVSANQVFGRVATPLGDRSMAAILTSAADALVLPDKGTMTTTDATGAPITLSRADAVKAGVSAIGAAGDHIALRQTEQGLRAERFDDAKARLTGAGLDLKAERSELEDTDLTYAVSAFQAKKTALDAAQAVYAQAHRQTLFDLIG